MPYYAEQEHDSCGLIKVRDEMEQHSTATLMEFQVNEVPESEEMMGYEDTSEYETIDTMGIETEIVDPFQEDFERGNTTEFPLSESSLNEEIITFENNAEQGEMVPISADPELVDPYQENFVQASGTADSILEFPLSESVPSDQLMNFRNNPAMNSSYIPAEFTVPYQTKVDHEIIAISDDEEEDEKMRQPQYLVKPSQRPIFPVFRQPRIPVPMVPMNMVANDSEIITLSDDDDAARPFHRGIKRKKSSRRRGIMFSPIECPFCRKQLRDNICMAKHLIKRHWQSVRIHNSGGKKGTDYFNLKDDREIPAEKYEDEKPQYAPHPPSLPLGPMPPLNQFRQRDDLSVGQPLKPTFMQGMQPPYRGIPGYPDNGSIFNKSGSFSHLPSGSANLEKPKLAPPGDAGDSREGRNEAADDLGHPDNRKMVQQKLGMLMHAHKCDGKKPNRKQNSFFQEIKDCALPECKNTKEVLKHLPDCVASTDCMVPNCFMSKQIIKWALSAQSPGVLTEMRNELNRQAKAGLPQDVVQWALKQPFDKEQWKSWRDKKLAKAPVPNNQGLQQSSLPTTLLNMNNVFPPSQPVDSKLPNTSQPNPGYPPKPTISINNLGIMPTLQRKPINAEMQKEATKPEALTLTPTQTLENKPISDWKKKYIEAAERRRGNQTTRKPTAPQPKTDKLNPSKAPVDFLSGLLSSQNATAELRKVRKPEPIIDKRYQNVNKRPTPSSVVKPKPTPPPSTPLQATTSGQEAAMYNSMLSL